MITQLECGCRPFAHLMERKGKSAMYRMMLNPTQCDIHSTEECTCEYTAIGGATVSEHDIVKEAEGVGWKLVKIHDECPLHGEKHV